MADVKQPVAPIQLTNMGSIGFDMSSGYVLYLGDHQFYATDGSSVNNVMTHNGGRDWIDAANGDWTEFVANGMVSNSTTVVAVGSGGQIYTAAAKDISYNVSSYIWAQQTPDASYTGDFRQVVWNGSVFVAIGDNSCLQTSPDGLAWTAVFDGTQPPGFSGSGTVNFEAVTTLDGRIALVITASSGTDQFSIWVSDDSGSTWSQSYTDDTAVLGFYDLASGTLLGGFQFGGIKCYIASYQSDGGKRYVISSDGGDSFSLKNDSGLLTTYTAIIQDGVLITGDGTSIEYTSDLDTWHIVGAGELPVIPDVQTDCGYTIALTYQDENWYRSLPVAQTTDSVLLASDLTPIGNFWALNFTGSGVVVDDLGDGVANVTIESGGGGGGGGSATPVPVAPLQFTTVGPLANLPGGVDVDPKSVLSYAGYTQFFALTDQYSGADQSTVSWDGGNTWEPTGLPGSYTDRNFLSAAGNTTTVVAVGGSVGGGSGAFIASSPTISTPETGQNYTWTSRTADNSYNSKLYQVIWTGSVFVTIGDNTELQTSTDGTTWTSRINSVNLTSVLAGISGSNHVFRKVDSANGTIILAVTADSERYFLCTSTDSGATWEITYDSTDDVAAFDFHDIAAGTLLDGSYAYASFHSSDAGFRYLVSSDGLTWTNRGGTSGLSPGEFALVRLVVQDGFLIGSDNHDINNPDNFDLPGRVEYTADLETWRTVTHYPPYPTLKTDCGYTLDINYGVDAFGGGSADFYVAHSLPVVPGIGGGGGSGSVVGPDTTIIGDIVTWDSTDGTVIADPGIAAADLFIGPPATVGTGNVVTFADSTGKLGADSGIPVTDLFVGPASSTIGHLVAFADGTGKLGQDTGVLYTEIFIAAPSSTTNNIVVFADNSGGVAADSGVSISDIVLTSDPLPSHAIQHEFGGSDEINVTNLTGVLAEAQKVSVLEIGNSTFTRPTLAFTTSTPLAIDFAITDDVGNNRVQIDISSPTIVGPGSSVDGNLVAFSGATGKIAQDSGISASSIAAIGSSLPVNVMVQSASAGVSTTAARSDHAHDVTVAAPIALTVGGTNSAGSSTSLARSDHSHGLPAFGTTAGTFAEGNDSRLSDDRVASGLRTTSTVVNVSSAIAPVAGMVLMATSSTAAQWTDLDTDAAVPSLNEFRLSPVSGSPFTSDNFLTCSNIYITPMSGNTMGLWNGSTWKQVTSSEINYPLSGRTANLPFDIFAYMLSGGIAIEVLNWASSSARSTGLTRLNGVLVKSGDATRRYLGTCRPRSASTYSWAPRGYDDPPGSANAVRLDLWNASNRLDVAFNCPATTNQDNDTLSNWYWPGGTSWRQVQGSPNYQVDVLCGYQEDSLRANAHLTVTDIDYTEGAYTAIGLDSSTIPSGSWNGIFSGLPVTQYGLSASFDSTLSIGSHSLIWLERAVTAVGSPTANFIGLRDDVTGSASSGITGVWRC